MPAEREPQQESHEKEPIDFARIFREKLASIKPSKSGELENIRIRDWPSGVKIKKEAVALVVLNIEDQLGKYELWLDGWQDIINKISPHAEVRRNLQNFCKRKELEGVDAAYDDAFLIESREGELWLLVDGQGAKDIEEEINKRRHIEMWLDLCSRYNIKKIIGDLDKKGGSIVIPTGETREILNQDIVGQIREERHLLDFIEKHRDVLDTNTKILRFRVLAETAREAAKKQEGNEKTPYSLEGLLEDMEKENGRAIN